MSWLCLRLGYLIILSVICLNTYASETVLIECGPTGAIPIQNPIPGNPNNQEFVVHPGINIINFSSSIVTKPNYLGFGAPCAVAIANLLTAKFKIVQSGSIGDATSRDEVSLGGFPTIAPFMDHAHNYVILLVK